jgi:hypothetical protein
VGKVKHGEATRSGKSAEWGVWTSMIQRCYDPNCKSYVYYGAKDIKVCKRWLYGEGGKHPVICFIEDMGRRPSSLHQIDRIDNNKGYFPSNCRWVTKSEQMLNRGCWNSHGYKYVRKWGNKFAANIRVNGRTVYLGLFATPAEASAAAVAAKQLNT